MSSYTLCVLGEHLRLTVNEPSIARLLASCYSEFVSPDSGAVKPALVYEIQTDRHAGAWRLTDPEHETTGEGLANLLYTFEKSLTIALQYLRPDLYFLHAAVLARAGRCVAIIGASGSGKSTLCWELCTRGFGYMSDELAPVDLETHRVYPYPRAICLKKTFDRMTPLPSQVIDADATLHIPTDALSRAPESEPLPLDAMLFLTASPAVGGTIERMAKAQATARVYANSLNPLAHDREGLRGAAEIAAAVEAWRISRASPQTMIQSIRSALGTDRF